MTSVIRFSDSNQWHEILVFLHQGKKIIIIAGLIYDDSMIDELVAEFDLSDAEKESVSNAINSLTSEVNSAELLVIVQDYPSYIEFVEDQTPDLCLAAVKEYGMMVKYVHNQTPEICIEAVKNDPWAYEFVCTELRTEEISIEAVKRNGFVVEMVEIQTSTICQEAVKQNPKAEMYVKDKTMLAQVA